MPAKMTTQFLVSTKICLPALVAIFAAAGCGQSESRPPTAQVSGKVTFEGQPVTEGTVHFISSEMGTAGSGALNAQGEYQITEGIPPGTYQVCVTPPSSSKPPMPGQPPQEMKEYPNIPEKARTETSSGLTAEVKKGENKGIDFKLD